MISSVDHTGKIFGRLTVLCRSPKKRRANIWAVRCECGKEDEVPAGLLTSGRRKSCGCLKANIFKTSHGMSRTPEHRAWCDVLSRCTNTKHRWFSDYGARGITVCERWRDFDNFFADMGHRPPGMSIERIDVNGNYEPGNCTWANNEAQANNKRGMAKYSVDGKWLSVSQLGRHLGITRHEARKRTAAGEFKAMVVGEEAGATEGAVSDSLGQEGGADHG